MNSQPTKAQQQPKTTNVPVFKNVHIRFTERPKVTGASRNR